MPTSNKKAAANRLNAQKSTGPINTSSTRFNAAKHGLLAVGVTELDDPASYRAELRDLTKEKSPVGTLETFLVEAATLDMVRWRRARRLEAEYLTSVLNPRIVGPSGVQRFEDVEGDILDPGFPALVDPASAQRLVSTFLRYESAIVLRLFRTLHELERLQRMRMGERLPAPATVDINVHADAEMVERTTVLERSEASSKDEDSAAGLDGEEVEDPAHLQTAEKSRLDLTPEGEQ